jgi:DNA-directed RNA polymerase specialized sigma24 family protein
MTTTDAAEDTLQGYLRADPDRALAYLHEHFGLLIARYLKRVTWSLLGAEDLKDAYQETLKGVLEKVRAPGFEPARPLRLVYAIARRKGLDCLRRRGHRPVADNALLHRITAEPPGPERLGPAEAKEFREVLLQIVQALPDRQRLIARVFVDHFEEFRPRETYEPLARAVSAITGEPVNVPAVKSAWHAARGTIATELSRRGYPLTSWTAP